MPHHRSLRTTAGVLLLLVLATLPLQAQRSILKFDRITSEQGLSDNYVLCMLQDRQGLIWCGTRDGLNRYDGYNFIIYRPDIRDSFSISDGSVECLLEDSDGMIWIGTHNGGLNRFDRRTGRFLHFVHDPSDSTSINQGHISALCEQGRYLWIVTVGTGSRLCRFDRETGRAIRYCHSSSDPFSISSDDITGVGCDRSGNIWVGTENAGLNRFDPARGGFINGRIDRRYSPSETGAILRLRTGTDSIVRFWWSSIRLIADKERDILPDSLLIPQHVGSIYAVHADRSGRTWMGGAFGGIAIMEAGGRTHTARHNQYDPYSLGSNRVFCIMEDRSENIWIGTDKGINKFNHRNWLPRYHQYDPFDSNSIPNNVVRSITRDAAGNLWIATEVSGVNRISAVTGAITRYLYKGKRPRDIPDYTSNTVVCDSRENVWMGINGGLVRLEPRTGKVHHFHPGPLDGEHLPHSSVWSVLEDRRGRIWIGTFGGLCTFDNATSRLSYVPSGGPDGPIGNKILCLHEDRNGNIWVGTDDGLSVLESAGGSWRHYPSGLPGPGNDGIWYIHEDRDGIFWIATSGGGFNRFDPRAGGFEHFTERDGLAGNIACGILEDNRGRLWISTTRGLSLFDRRSRRFTTYALQDGFYIHEFHFKSCYKDEAGRLYFGGANGVLSFHPDSIEDNHHIPPVMITSFKVYGHERILSGAGIDEIRLDHDSNFFSLGFAALDFTNSRRNHYRYRLEGVDDQWRETDGLHPRADYTNIPPGSYTFQVIGANSDGIWNSTGASIRVIIEPAYWQSWWFRGGAMLLALGLAAAAITARIRSIRTKGMLERKMVEFQLKALRAQMNPHFIFNSLNSILLFILDHDINAAHRYLTKFANLMRSTLEHSKSEAVPLADELSVLECYLELEAVRLNHSFTYRIDVAPDIDGKAVMIPPMLIQPYVENSITHGLRPARAGGEITIAVRVEGSSIVISITDNGIGRTRAANARGTTTHRSRGMSVTRERLEILGSLSNQCYELDVIDLTGDEGLPLGTRVNIRIPVSVHLHQSEFIERTDIHATRNHR